MIRAGIYCRVSTDEQAKNGISLDCQQEALTKYATKMQYLIVDYYVDDGYTGTNLKRPGLQRLLQDVKDKKIDIVLITKLDRWGRGVKNYYKVDEILSENKVHWKTILEDYDTTTSAGKLHINIMLSIAENESAVTADRIKFVFKEKLQKKETLYGGNNMPYGYIVVDKHLVISPEEAEIVKDIFRTMSFLQSARKTRKTINARYNLNFDDRQIVRILKRDLYYGTYKGKRNGIVVEDFCEPIIEKKVFDDAQKYLNANIRQKSSEDGVVRDHIFSGLIRCKECGCLLKVNSNSYHTKSEKKYKTRYSCQRTSVGRYCKNNTSIGEKKLELILLTKLRKQMEELKDHYEEEYNNYLLDAKKETPTITNKSNYDEKKIKNQIDNLLSLYLEGSIPKDIYKEKYSELMLKLEECNKPLPTVEINYQKEINSLTYLLSQPIEEQYLMMTKLERRRFWRTIAKEIIFDEDQNVTVIFNLN